MFAGGNRAGSGSSPTEFGAGAGRAARQGCGGCLLVILIVIAVAVVSLANFQLVPTPKGEPVESRWVSAAARVTPDAPRAAIRVVVSYDSLEGASSGLPGEFVVSIGSPELAAGAGGAAAQTLDPLAQLRDPVVRVTVGGDASASCYAACQVDVPLTCSAKCSRTIDVGLELTNAAGRAGVGVSVTAGATSSPGGRLPSGFAVRVEAVR